MIVSAGQVITVIRRVVTGQDSYGNDIYGESSYTVDGVVIIPGNSSEDIQGTASVLSDVTIYVPDYASIGPFDAAILPDGQRYRVTGTPNTWSSPFTGTVSLTQVNLLRITGAMEQFISNRGGGLCPRLRLATTVSAR